MTIIYKVDTGEIITSSEHAMPESALDVALVEGLAAIEGFCSPDDGYVKDGLLKHKPEKPDDTYIFDLNLEEWVLSISALLAQVSEKRAYLLRASDWTQLPDVPLATKEEWAVYRQALRDLTEQPGYPTNVIWPVEPE